MKRAFCLFLAVCICLSLTACWGNSYHYEMIWYTSEEAQGLLSLYRKDYEAVRDILLRSNEFYNTREEDTTTKTIFDTDLREIKPYVTEDEFRQICKLYEVTGIVTVARQSNHVHFTYRLRETDGRIGSYTLYYFPDSGSASDYGNGIWWEDIFEPLDENWYYGIYYDRDI